MRKYFAAPVYIFVFAMSFVAMYLGWQHAPTFFAVSGEGMFVVLLSRVVVLLVGLVATSVALAFFEKIFCYEEYPPDNGCI